ncbi:MAG: acetylxylan esterase [Victivallales bacterium]|jgi:hypothetical protein
MNIPSVWTEPCTDLLNNSLRAEAARKFKVHQLPSDLEAWETRREELAAAIWKKLGVSADHRLALDYHETGSVRMDGYEVRKIYYQSRTGLYVTGNLYVPDGKKPFPAVLNLHGHWSQGRLAARVQDRGHSLAKNGYVCLSVDAFGSGERSTDHGVFEYHGNHLGASLMDIGETLMGVQVVDNMRAIDLLCSFDFVNKKKIGVTGASGGGNQTMWLAALDKRIVAAMPVVSVGTFESYVTRHNCICELLPDGLTFTEESGVLALVAPRALKLCNCLQDSNPTFHVSEMLRSFNEAKKIYGVLGAYDKFSSQAFNLPHGYYPEIREAMLGWFDLHLKGVGHGLPKRETPFTELPEEKIMVFKKGKRPAKVVGIAEYCRHKGVRLRKDYLGARSFDIRRKAEELSEILRISGWLEPGHIHEHYPEGIWRKFTLETSGGDMIPILVAGSDRMPGEFVLFAHPSGKDKVCPDAISEALKQNKGVILADLWGTGETHKEAVPHYATLSRTALWLGRSMQGEWAKQIDLLCGWASTHLKASKVSLHAYRETAVAALLLNAVKNTNGEIVLEESPVSYLFNRNVAPDYFSMALHLPEIMKWGDISLAAAMSNARVNFIRPVMSDGAGIGPEEILVWKKEFDSAISKCRSKTTVTFN